MQRKHESLIERYESHLLERCGLTKGTCRVFLRHVRRFLDSGCSSDVADLGPGDLILYVSELAGRHTPSLAKAATTSLRSFLRFLQLEGLCDARLVEAVPTVSRWGAPRLPRHLDDDQLRDFLESFDRSTAYGRRDYAVAVCLSWLGLRASEARSIQIDDVDWEQGTVRLPTTKSRRETRLPLPHHVGAAIADYLRDGRPSGRSRYVFVSHRGPTRGLQLSSIGMHAVIRRAFRRSNVDARLPSPHALRHTAATRMLRGGASLKEIADVLGHRSLDTTAIYARVDLAGLREVAMAWPGVER